MGNSQTFESICLCSKSEGFVFGFFKHESNAIGYLLGFSVSVMYQISGSLSALIVDDIVQTAGFIKGKSMDII